MALDFNLLNTNIPAEAASSAMKGMQQVNALTTQRLQNQASNMEIQNALAEQEAYKGAATPQEASQRLMQAGLGKPAMALNTALASQGKIKNETAKLSMDIMRERTKDILGNPSNENYIAHMQEGVRDGYVTPEQAQRSIQIYTSIPPNQRVAFLQQQLTKAEDIERNSIAKQNANTSAGQLAVSQERLKQETSTGALTPATTDLLAQMYIKTGQMPPMGMGAKANAMRQSVLNRAAVLSTGGGTNLDGTVAPSITPEEAAANIVQNKSSLIGTRASERTLGTNLANIVAAGSEAEKMISIAENYATKINPTDFPALNAAGNYVAKNSGDPVQAGLATSLNSLVNAYARAINPKGVATVSDKTHAREVIDAKMSSGQFKEVFNVMRQEMQAAQAAPEEARAKIRGTGPKKISSDNDYNALPSGAEFIAPDGSHRRKP